MLNKIPTPKVTFDQIRKYPQTYALLLVAMLMGFFVNQWTSNSRKEIEECRKEKLQWREMYIEKDKENQQLTIELLIKNEVIERMPSTIDSITRVKTDKYTKKLIKK